MVDTIIILNPSGTLISINGQLATKFPSLPRKGLDHEELSESLCPKHEFDCGTVI